MLGPVVAGAEAVYPKSLIKFLERNELHDGCMMQAVNKLKCCHCLRPSTESQ